MSGYIRRTACGNCIGIYQKFFNLAKEMSNKENLEPKYKNYLPNTMIIKQDTTKPLGYILDALNIYNVCCRSRIMTVSDFDRLQ